MHSDAQNKLKAPEIFRVNIRASWQTSGRFLLGKLASFYSINHVKFVKATGNFHHINTLTTKSTFQYMKAIKQFFLKSGPFKLFFLVSLGIFQLKFPVKPTKDARIKSNFHYISNSMYVLQILMLFGPALSERRKANHFL